MGKKFFIFYFHWRCWEGVNGNKEKVWGGLSKKICLGSPIKKYGVKGPPKKNICAPESKNMFGLRGRRNIQFLPPEDIKWSSPNACKPKNDRLCIKIVNAECLRYYNFSYSLSKVEQVIYCQSHLCKQWQFPLLCIIHQHWNDTGSHENRNWMGKTVLVSRFLLREWTEIKLISMERK